MCRAAYPVSMHRYARAKEVSRALTHTIPFQRGGHSLQRVHAPRYRNLKNSAFNIGPFQPPEGRRFSSWSDEVQASRRLVQAVQLFPGWQHHRMQNRYVSWHTEEVGLTYPKNWHDTPAPKVYFSMDFLKIIRRGDVFWWWAPASATLSYLMCQAQQSKPKKLWHSFKGSGSAMMLAAAQKLLQFLHEPYMQHVTRICFGHTLFSFVFDCLCLTLFATKETWAERLFRQQPHSRHMYSRRAAAGRGRTGAEMAGCWDCLAISRVSSGHRSCRNSLRQCPPEGTMRNTADATCGRTPFATFSKISSADTKGNCKLGEPAVWEPNRPNNTPWLDTPSWPGCLPFELISGCGTVGSRVWPCKLQEVEWRLLVWNS